MYSVLNVSNYIINYGNKKGFDITLEKLNKLLYFTQAAFIKIYDRVAFEEEMILGTYDIRVKDVWKKYGDSYYGEILRDNEKYLMADNDKILIGMIVDALGGYDERILFEVIEKNRKMKSCYEITPNMLRERFRDILIKGEDILWLDKFKEIGVKESDVLSYWDEIKCDKNIKYSVFYAKRKGFKGRVYNRVYNRVRVKDAIEFFGDDLRDLEFIDLERNGITGD